MNAKGKVFKYGADIDTDVIIPARYLNTSVPAELAKHCMEDSKQDINAGLAPFSQRVTPGAIMVADKNFGCGSSREHAPIAIKACGVSCVIAKTFARIFYRNSINIGLPILECPEAVEILMMVILYQLILIQVLSKMKQLERNSKLNHSHHSCKKLFNAVV